MISQEHVINYFKGYNGLELEGEHSKSFILKWIFDIDIDIYIDQRCLFFGG